MPNSVSPEDPGNHLPPSKKTEKYLTEQLHNRDANGWAVVAFPAGSIALRDGRLLMKLSQAEAERLAALLNEELFRAT